MSMWSAPLVRGRITATVELPGSKSITNRALILAALAEGPSTVTGTLRSRDTDLMIDGLAAMGTDVHIDPADPTRVTITPAPLHGGEIDCGLAGTVMRFLPAVAAFADGPVRFDGDAQARARPMATVLDALRSLGVEIDGDSLPLTVVGDGRAHGGEVTIDASASSQFVSGLLLSAPRFDEGVIIRHVGSSIPSTPHIDMTVEMLATAGVEVNADVPNVWRVTPGPIRAVDRAIEPDLSNAAAFLAAAAPTGGSVTVPRWPALTTQPGVRITEILAEMGCTIEYSDGALTVTGPARLSGIDLDLHDVGELTPTVAALCALASGASTLSGIAHLRGHETDRLRALSTEINRLGGECVETEGGLRIVGGGLHGGTWHAYSDHRMATAGALIGLRVPDVFVDDIETTSKTMPDFPAMWRQMIGNA